MANIYNGNNLPIAYAHTINYFSKGIDAQGPYYRVEYYITDWTQSDAFVNALKGITTITGGAGGQVTKTAPHQHPLSPNLYCAEAHCRGTGLEQLNAQGYPSYAGGALIEATYRPMVPLGGFQMTPSELLQQIDPATPILWCTQELEFTTEYFIVPGSQSTVKFTSGAHSGDVVGIPFKINVPITYLNLTFHKVPYMPAASIRAVQGNVNSTTFLGAPAGYVLFKGARVVRDCNSDGTVVQKVMLVFANRTATGQKWNYLPDIDLGWQSVAASGGATLYPTADLNTIIIF